MKFVNSIKNTDKIYSTIKEAYKDANIPLHYPAANKQLQSRLRKFVSKGLTDNQSVSTFDKVNSNRIYTLEKQNDTVQLIMQVKEKDQAAKKLVVLPVDDEIKLIVTSYIKIFEETGFIESAPKCHKRLRDTYAISDGRIRLVQRILAKYVTSASIDNKDKDEDKDEDEDADGKRTTKFSPVKVTRSITNDENSPPQAFVSSVTTRSKSILNKKCKNVREHINSTKHQVKKKQKY